MQQSMQVNQENTSYKMYWKNGIRDQADVKNFKRKLTIIFEVTTD